MTTRSYYATVFYMIVLGVFVMPFNSLALTIADKPLYLTTSVDPNITITLDDSGSMLWEILPQAEVIHYNIFPQNQAFFGPNYYGYASNGSFSSSSGSADMPGHESNNSQNYRLRSASVNRVYYNPQVLYKPWLNADGSAMSPAVPTCALNNPMDATKGCRNLTVLNDGAANSVTDSFGWWQRTNAGGTLGWQYGSYVNGVTGVAGFWPSVYYNYNGAGGCTVGTNTAACYTRVEIKPVTPTYTGSATRTDCVAAPTCTYAEEIQNFANWYTYYRTRIQMARGGMGRAMGQLGANTRLGFATINNGATTVDGVASTGSMVAGVRQFSGANRATFYNTFYTYPIPTSGTPSRWALDNVGQYFSRTDNSGPWGENPGVGGGTQYACRQSFNLFVTDGYWNGTPATVASGNVDNAAGPTMTNQTVGGTPTSFSYSPSHPYQDAWSDTLADVAMYYWDRDLLPSIDNKVPVNTQDPAFWQHLVTFGVSLGLNGTLNPATDLPGLTSGVTPWPDPTIAEDASRLDDLWHAAINGRGSFLNANDPQELANSVSTAFDNIIGRVSASAALSTNTNTLSATSAIYQARFDSTDWTGQFKAFPVTTSGIGAELWSAAPLLPAFNSRNIKTWNGAAGVDFAWGSISATQQLSLGSSAMLSYLRGDSSNEIINGGSYRNRANKLGDIVNSDPLFVGKSDSGYDSLPSTEGSSYPAFVTSKSSRPDMVYVGANEGMLHGFDASSGVERFAYVPANVYSNLPSLASNTYSHRYFVDGPANSNDVYYGSQWHTVLVGGLGAGGRSVFALDITDPPAFSTSKVLWEYTDTDLGYTFGQPAIARFNDGKYYAVFGNGYNSTNNRAVLYLVQIDNPAIVKKIDTGVGSAPLPNGLSAPALLDLNRDGSVDVIYAGDLQGNLWKFDVSSTSMSSWDSAFTSGTNKLPLFTARNATNQVQPITAAPEIGAAPSALVNGVAMVFFGTGSYFTTTDVANTNIQTIYGIADNGTRISVTDRSSLAQQTILGSVAASGRNTYVVSNNSVNYQTQIGFYLDFTLPSGNTINGERVVVSPILRNGRIIFNTLLPASDPCSFGGTSNLMELDANTGGRLSYSVFDLNGDGSIDSGDYVSITVNGVTMSVPVSGLGSGVGIAKNPIILKDGQNEKKFQSGNSGMTEMLPSEKGDIIRSRASWRQIQ
jgi:type IV pilus assembly protein PilY1